MLVLNSLREYFLLDFWCFFEESLRYWVGLCWLAAGLPSCKEGL